MKKNTLSLLVLMVTATIFISSCTKDKYPPSLTLELEPYVIYYNDTKYTLYDTQGNLDPTIPDNVVKLGDVQSYIDTVTNLKYTVDDKGDFWSAENLNEYYKYPGYRVSGYGETEPTVTVTFPDEVGNENDNGIDLKKATSFEGTPYYTFTYTATDDGETTVKKVHLRVYNSYADLNGIYISRVSLPATEPNSGRCLWLGNNGKDKDGNNTVDDNQTSYGFGEASKNVSISVDKSIDMKLFINRLLDNKKMKGAIRGDSKTLPSGCVIGDKKTDEHDVIEILYKGPVSDYDLYTFGFAEEERDTVITLVVVENVTGSGSIKNIYVKDIEGNDIQVPLITLVYKVKRYKRKPAYEPSPDYTYDGVDWVIIDTHSEKWTNTVKETFIKQVYWTDENKDRINEQSGHE